MWILKFNESAMRLKSGEIFFSDSPVNCLKKHVFINIMVLYFDGLVQDCTNSIANVPEFQQSYAKPSI